MAQHKIDDQIKSKLNTREIQPSAQAWDRLDAMLTVSQDKKSKKGYGWFFVAASVVLFFGFGFLFFYENETPKTNNSIPVVTKVDEDIDSIGTNKIALISTENTKPILVQNEANNPKLIRNSKSFETKELIKVTNEIQENPTSIIHHPSSINFKYVSTEKLLVEVQVNEKEIPSDRKNNSKSKIKIDAASLLSTVEKELDENYKETTLDKLTRKFQDAKTAIVNRNYE